MHTSNAATLTLQFHTFKMFLLLLFACFIRFLMLVIVSSSPILSLLYDPFILYRATFLTKVTLRSSLLLSFFHYCLRSDPRKSTGTAVIMQMFQWNSFLNLPLQCVFYSSQNYCNLFSCHSTTHILSLSLCVLTHILSLSLSLSLSCLWWLKLQLPLTWCHRTIWLRLSRFWSLPPFHKTPWARCVAKSVPVIQVACRFESILRDRMEHAMTVLEHLKVLRPCKLNTRNWKLVRVNITLTSRMKVEKIPTYRKTINKLMRSVIGRSAVSSESIMLNSLKTEFNVRFV